MRTAIKNRAAGLTLLEVVVYVSLLSFLFVLIFDSALAAYRTFAFSRTSRDVNVSAELVLERFMREARDAETIDREASIFGVHPGALVLSGEDENGDPRTATFSLEDRGVLLEVSGQEPLVLTSRLASTTQFVFYDVMASSSEAVRLELTIEGSNKPVPLSKNFYATAVLRGSY